MKLFFDARYIRTDFHDGISRYTTELGTALAELTPVTFIVSDEAQLKFLPEGVDYVRLHKVTSPLEPFASLRLNKHRPDVVFSPLQTFGSFGRRFKLILTLHDTIYHQFNTSPPQYNALLRLGWRLYHATHIPQRFTLNRADVVATVSHASRQEIEERRLTKRPVVVISNAARDLSPLLDGPVILNTDPPKNLIYMGSFIPYKNVETLLKMMEHLPGRRLHLLSRISPAREQRLRSLMPDGADVIFHNGVSDQDYAKLLADDAIMVSASKAEGYGLPLAEALALGVPAVVSDLAIFHEVAGEGALYADPEDSAAFAAAISRLDDLATRQTLVESGQIHIATFSWRTSAEVLRDSCLKLADS